MVSCEWCLRDDYLVYMTALSELNCGAKQDVYRSAVNWCVSARLKYAQSSDDYIGCQRIQLYS